MVKQGIFWISSDVGDMNRPPFKQCSTEFRSSFRFDCAIFDIIDELLREAVRLGTVEGSIFFASNLALIGIAELSRRFNERLQHCVEVEGRAADDFEHL